LCSGQHYKWAGDDLILFSRRHAIGPQALKPCMNAMGAVLTLDHDAAVSPDGLFTLIGIATQRDAQMCEAAYKTGQMIFEGRFPGP